MAALQARPKVPHELNLEVNEHCMAAVASTMACKPAICSPSASPCNPLQAYLSLDEACWHLPHEALVPCVHSRLDKHAASHPLSDISCLVSAGTGHRALHQAYKIAVPYRSRSPQAAFVSRSFATPKCCTSTATYMVLPDIVAAVMLRHSDLVAQRYASCCSPIS